MAYFTGDPLYNIAKVLSTPIILPASGLYALGGVINEATGGTTTTYDLGTALRGGSTGTVFSNTILAIQPYDPGSNVADGKLGTLQIPFLNRHLPEALKDAVDIIPPWAKAALIAIGVLAVTK